MLNQRLDYSKLVQEHPWIINPDQKCILSPDTDGFLCGLLMSHYLGWQVVGFYDGKTLRIQKGNSADKCIFLDVEILRPTVKSIGHHMTLHNSNNPPENYTEVLKNCINPNHIRGFDRAHNFYQKYPLGTIHLLLFILEEGISEHIEIKKEGLGTIFFADGIWKILFKYTHNFLDWFNFLRIDGRKSDWWEKLQELSVIDLISEIDSLFGSLEGIHPHHRRWYGHVFDEKGLDENQREKILFDFIQMLATLTGWKYNSSKWKLDKLVTRVFTKRIDENNTNNEDFLNVWSQHPLSFAMTNKPTIQYTLEKPDTLF